MTVTKTIERFAYAFQVSVKHPTGVKVVEATRDTKQLKIDDEDRPINHHEAGKRTHETWTIDFLLSPHVVQHIAILHPFRNHAKLKQLRCNALDGQNIFVPYSRTDGDLFAVLLGRDSCEKH